MPSLLLCLLVVLVAAAPATAQGPRTAFEENDGAAWTTHPEEVAFLARVAAESPRVNLQEIGRSKGELPLHIVEVSAPGPVGAQAARRRPTALMVCTQHGNEPSGREACLKHLRDLAFSTDAKIVSLLERSTFIYVPTANPDGRAANSRQNLDPQDVNRDHLGLTSLEARAMAAAVRDYQPDVSLDLHEYGPSQPVLYDDPVLWLWPRNLNTDAAVHDLAIELGRKYLVPSIEEAGYTADEYGQQEVADNDIAQTAGDADEGIMRNAMGLRHVLGILLETRVDADVRQSPTEPLQTAEVRRRRVDSHMAALRGLVRFMDERGPQAAQVTGDAMARKAAEGRAQSAPLFFDGADNQAPSAAGTVNPPPCGYRLTEAQVGALGPALELHGIQMFRLADGPFVSLGQPAEPLIPLLLDARGRRHAVEGEAVMANCPAVPSDTARPPSPAKRPVAGSGCLKPRTLVMKLPRVRGKLLSVRVTANGRRVKVRRRVAYVKLRKRGSTVRVVVLQRVRSDGKVRTRRTVRRYRVCR